MAQNPLRLALLISGGGTTMRALLDAMQDGRLTGVEPALVLSSDPGAGGITKAQESPLLKREDITVVQRSAFPTSTAFGEAILAKCRERDVDLIGQYGWLPLTPANVVRAYEGRMLNQHPGPLDFGRPDFGGKGMYGRRVHAARLLFTRLTRHDPWTEVVCHRVTEEYDRGAVVHAQRVPILETDDVNALQMRALPVEHRVQIEALQMFIDGTVREIVRAEPLVRRDEYEQLKTAKDMAGLLYPNG